MNYKDPSKDSGSYVNGVYTTKNGFSGTGLNCPRGARLYNTEITQAVFFEPEDTAKGEEFRRLTPDAAPDVLPYYAISNYGRIENTYSGKIIKPNYRPNGYEYVCLAAKDCKNGQKKYNTHRLVMKQFSPTENMDELQVNHINGIKSDNYINKIMPDGSVQSNLEWSTPQENSQHASDNGWRSNYKLSKEDVEKIRNLHDNGYSYGQILFIMNKAVSGVTIQNVCLNKIYYDPNYTPVTFGEVKDLNPANYHRLSDKDVKIIRSLYSNGYNCADIKEQFYPTFSESTISDVIRRITHNNI